MCKGNVNGSLKLLKNNMSNGILPLTVATLQLLKQKHPESREPPPEVLIEGPIRKTHPVVYDDIDESLILKAVTLTKGGSGPSGLDADGWRRILISRVFGTLSADLRKTFAQLIKRLCIEELETTTFLEAFTACRLILLDKKPGLRPIGVGEILRRIAGKVIMMTFKKDITYAAGPLQLSTGQEAGTEAATHAVQDIFANEDTEAVLLIDAENAFNSINRKVMNFICPIITTYITNYYITPARLFIIGGGKILSQEGTNQGDPTAMGAYTLGILPLIHFLLEFISINHLSAKQIAFADNFTVAGKLTSIRDYWGKLTVLCPKCGYFPKASKSFLIVKEDKLGEARNVFNDSNVNISIEGKRHLGAVIGSNDKYREKYVKDLVNDWNNQLALLSSIAESHSQVYYQHLLVVLKVS